VTAAHVIEILQASKRSRSPPKGVGSSGRDWRDSTVSPKGHRPAWPFGAALQRLQGPWHQQRQAPSAIELKPSGLEPQQALQAAPSSARSLWSTAPQGLLLEESSHAAGLTAGLPPFFAKARRRYGAVAVAVRLERLHQDARRQGHKPRVAHPPRKRSASPPPGLQPLGDRHRFSIILGVGGGAVWVPRLPLLLNAVRN